MAFDRDLTAALGVAPRATPFDIATAMLRIGLAESRHYHDSELSACAITYFAELGEALAAETLWDGKVSLATTPERLTTVALRELRRVDAAAVLAVLAPHQHVPGGPAGQMGRACTALVGQHLPQFIGNLLARWVDHGFVRDVDQP